MEMGSEMGSATIVLKVSGLIWKVGQWTDVSKTGIIKMIYLNRKISKMKLLYIPTPKHASRLACLGG